jgi:hypothetical protein
MPVGITHGEREWDPNRTEKQCAYCSLQLTVSNRTKEDYWPRWLQKKFPHQRGERSAHFTRGLWRPDREVSKGMLMIRDKLPVVCKACNNEFGSLIQNAAKPAIHQILSRGFRSLSIDQLHALAKWAIMFAMTWEFADYATKSISQTSRERFRLNSEIPENFSIWLGRYCGTGFQLTQQHLSNWHTHWPIVKESPDIGDKGYLMWTRQLTTIGLGPLFICVYSYEDFGWSVVNIPQPLPYLPEVHLAKRQILNITSPSSNFEIETMPSFSDGQLQNLALGFEPAERRGRYRRIGPMEGVSNDFWRSWTTEPDWQ